tara:strand:+ start:87 stop:1007 length:921 start_codon:yes stop_codon:yes gene_type:complete
MATTTTRTLPPQFIEDIGVDLSKSLVASTGVPTVSVGLSAISQRPGESAADFAARQTAAKAFETRQQSLAGIAPQIAQQDQLQKDAAALAASGVGAYKPYVAGAEQLMGAGAGTGAGSISEYMSPYQQQVIDVSLQEFDRNAGIQRQRLRDQAVQAGAFGGGREEIALSEYQTGSDRERALLQANLLQQGFQQAQQARGQDFERQRGLASMVPGLQRQDIQTLGSVGAVQQAQTQAGLDAQREAARQATFLPQENLSRYAGQVAGLMGGYPGQTTSSNVPNPSPLQNALTMGTGLAGIYGSLTGKY